MVEFKILYFATARDAALDKSSETLEVDDGRPATLASAVECITAKYPKMRAVLESAMVALNEDYCDKDNMSNIKLKSSDTVAIIPPVSGG
ncbi:hypothetical protein GGI21_001401 [Coemansia aciculifera]|uniref:Uncharacterized protein n=1 Tax=Coemansia aciculifera TaxID=417176 RepID=A0ACC1M6W1_9FUNG|nr:hypothetical protein IWW38_001454 [Coemansia aciculifera]KAJ2909915.1 hypothetical protein GGI21_001401 [Coemansia aciculifera]